MIRFVTRGPCLNFFSEVGVKLAYDHHHNRHHHHHHSSVQVLKFIPVYHHDHQLDGVCLYPHEMYI